MSDEDFSSDSLGIDNLPPPTNKPVTAVSKKEQKQQPSFNEPSGSFNMDLSDLSTDSHSKPSPKKTTTAAKPAPMISETSDINVDLNFSDDSAPPKPTTKPSPAKPAAAALESSDEGDVSVNFDDDIDFDL